MIKLSSLIISISSALIFHAPSFAQSSSLDGLKPLVKIPPVMPPRAQNSGYCEVLPNNWTVT